MNTENPTLPLGYSPVAPGQIVNVVTCLEMLQRPEPKPASPEAGLSLERWPQPDLDGYRALYRLVGEDWLWFSRLVMPDDELRAILHDPLVEVHVLRDGARQLGLLELDFRTEGQCELAFFGVVKDAIGKGTGRLLMNHAISTAWSRPIRRFWVHTCTFDHPAAIGFYQRSGFKPYEFMVEVLDDPRLSRVMARGAAAHIPLIDPV